MAISLRATRIFFLISTSLAINEITSSSIEYAILVPSCILQFLSLLCIFRNSRIKQPKPVICPDASPLDILVLLAQGIWALLSRENAKGRPNKPCLVFEAGGANERFCCAAPADIGYAAQVRLCTLQFLRVFCFLAEDRTIRGAPKRHPRAVRQHDIWSYGWHTMALLIRSLTSQFLTVDFCPGKKTGSWMLIDRRSGTVIAEKVIISSLSSSVPRVLYKGSVERNNYSRSRPGNSICRPPQELLVKIVDKLSSEGWAHFGNGGIEQKVYKKSRTAHPGKHGHNVGSTAFRNWAQGGDGSGEDRAIQDDWGSPDTTVNSSVQMTSSQAPPRPTPPPPPQTLPSPTLRAAPQVQPPTPASQVQRPTTTPQVQPPIPTTPPAPAPAPSPPPPPPPRGWFNFNFTGWFTSNFAGWFNFNVPSLAKIFLAISATLVLAPPQIVQGGGNSLSANDKTLLFGTKLFGLAGFIFCLLAYIVQQDNIAAKLLIAFGVVADILGLLFIVALGR